VTDQGTTEVLDVLMGHYAQCRARWSDQAGRLYVRALADYSDDVARSVAHQVTESHSIPLASELRQMAEVIDGGSRPRPRMGGSRDDLPTAQQGITIAMEAYRGEWKRTHGGAEPPEGGNFGMGLFRRLQRRATEHARATDPYADDDDIQATGE